MNPQFRANGCGLLFALVCGAVIFGMWLVFLHSKKPL